jgi:hypothetical protein
MFLLDRIIVSLLILSIILCLKGLLVRYFSLRVRHCVRLLCTMMRLCGAIPPP